MEINNQNLFPRFATMFQGDKLRIITPVCGPNGNVLIHNGRVVTRETEAPIEARKSFEKENTQFEKWGKPELKHQIQIISSAPVVDLRELKPIVPAIPFVETKPKSKRGRKPKIKNDE